MREKGGKREGGRERERGTPCTQDISWLSGHSQCIRPRVGKATASE